MKKFVFGKGVIDTNKSKSKESKSKESKSDKESKSLDDILGDINESKDSIKQELIDEKKRQLDIYEKKMKHFNDLRKMYERSVYINPSNSNSSAGGSSKESIVINDPLMWSHLREDEYFSKSGTGYAMTVSGSSSISGVSGKTILSQIGDANVVINGDNLEPTQDGNLYGVEFTDGTVLNFLEEDENITFFSDGRTAGVYNCTVVTESFLGEQSNDWGYNTGKYYFGGINSDNVSIGFAAYDFEGSRYEVDFSIGDVNRDQGIFMYYDRFAGLTNSGFGINMRTLGGELICQTYDHIVSVVSGYSLPVNNGERYLVEAHIPTLGSLEVKVNGVTMSNVNLTIDPTVSGSSRGNFGSTLDLDNRFIGIPYSLKVEMPVAGIIEDHNDSTNWGNEIDSTIKITGSDPLSTVDHIGNTISKVPVVSPTYFDIKQGLAYDIFAETTINEVVDTTGDDYSFMVWHNMQPNENVLFSWNGSTIINIQPTFFLIGHGDVPAFVPSSLRTDGTWVLLTVIIKDSKINVYEGDVNNSPTVSHSDLPTGTGKVGSEPMRLLKTNPTAVSDYKVRILGIWNEALTIDEINEQWNDSKDDLP